MSTYPLNTVPGLEELKTCAAFLQQGLLQSERQTTAPGSRRIIICPICIMLSATVLTRASGLTQNEFPKHLFLTDCRDFLVDAMWVLTNLPKADDERKIWPDLRRAYNICHEQNNRTEYSDKELVSLFTTALTAIVAQCLRFAVKNPSLPWSTRFRTKGAWPSSISDILPGSSPRLAMLNLLRYWSRHYKEAVYTRMLLAVILQVPSIPDEIAAALMDARHVFLPAYCERATALGHELQYLSIGSPEFGVAEQNLDNLVILSLTIVQTLPMAKISPHQFVSGHEDQLNAAFDVAVHGESFLVKPPEMSIAGVRVLLLLNIQGSSSSEELETNFQALNTFSGRLRPGQDPYTRFYSIAIANSRESRCGARGCQRYGGQGTSKLMRCSRCRVYQYCSRECQRAHWTDEIRPHKAVCATLKRIQDAYPLTTGEPDQHAFSAACRSAGIQVEELMRPCHYFISAIMLFEHSDAEGMESVRHILNPPPELAAIEHTSNETESTVPRISSEKSSKPFTVARVHMTGNEVQQSHTHVSRGVIVTILCLLSVILAHAVLTGGVPTWLSRYFNHTGN